MTSRPVVIVGSVLAALQVLTGGAALADFIGVQLAGLCILLVASAQVGMTFYLQAVVTPLSNPRTEAGVPLVPQPAIFRPTLRPDLPDPGQ